MQHRPAHAAAVAAHRPQTAGTALARAWPSVAIVVAVAIIVVLGFEDGGYFPSSFVAAGAAAFIALGVLLLGARVRRRVSTDALLALGLLAAFAAWTGLSSAWSTVPDTPLLDMQRAMLYAALFGLAVLAADSGPHARALVRSVLAAIVVIVGAGLVSRLQPDILAGTTDAFTGLSYRLGYPLEYWNAFGGLASMGAVLAVGLAADRRAAAPLRAIFAASGTLLLVAMYFSLSRGAWLALAVGLVALLALSPHRGSLAVSAGLAGAALAVAILRLGSHPALVEDPAAGTGQLVQGDAFTLELLVLVAGVAALQGAVASQRFKRRAPEVGRSALIVTGALVAAVAMVGYATNASRADRAVSDAGAFVERQWDDFLQTTATGTQVSGSERLLNARGARSAGYRVALDAFRSQPVRGEGAGSFEVRWMRTREIDLKMRDAHSLALETLAELGTIGMLILVGFVVVVARGARRCLRGRGTLAPMQAAAVSAAFGVWLAHACVDWTWQMPAVTGTALVLGGTLMERGRRRRLGPRPSVARGG
ncbi:MAG: O-antigen ligase family protein [Solirubrobacteraceae bacterium]